MFDISSQMIDFPSNEHTTPGYLAQPLHGEHPGLVVIQEWWGLVPHIKDVAERFARQGFVALAPDLYHGQSAAEPDEARKLAMELDRERAVGEILAAVRYLESHQAVFPKKVGLIGWCMGGSLVISTAATSERIGAAVVFYGRAADLGLVAHIHAPLLGLYGELDHGIPVETVLAFEAKLEEQGVPHEIHIYPGAQHAFFNDSRPHIYHPQAAQDAWQKTLEWLNKHLA